MTKRTLLICTTNPGKLTEFREFFASLPFEVKSLTDMGFSDDFEIEEPGKTFEGNAIIKAMTLGTSLKLQGIDTTNLLIMADDSGLEVDALGGRPGVQSARYGASSEERRARLLGELSVAVGASRVAQFHCVLAILDPQRNKIRTCEGISRGRILHEARGESDFGFDPIFFDEVLEKAYGEMSPSEKFSVSHRGKALRLAREVLLKEFA